MGEKFEKLHLSLLKINSDNTNEYLSKLFNTYQELVGIWWLSILLGDALPKYICSYLKISEGKLLSIVGDITKKTLIERQIMGVRKIANIILKNNPEIKQNKISISLIKNNKPLYNKIKNFINQFKWFGTHHWMGEPYNIKKLIVEVKSVKVKDKKIVKLNRYNNKSLLKLMGTINYWRTHCAEITCKVVYESKPLLKKCAKMWGLNYDKFIYLSSKEILVNIASTQLSLPKNFIKRSKGYGCYVSNKGEEKIVVGKKLQSLLNSLVGSVSKSFSEIRGTVASKGKIITGKVKVLISPKDFSSFHKGDILVAPETTPDFVPYMKLASAIITDRGGVTSHAAIVSRELGIPCIIGTKIATKVLKDGDLVEVDANKGIVKILKRAQ